MKASEVLRRYKDGRRDFGGESLRGQSFKGMNLTGADFSEADIRGANFTNACLRGAKFGGAKAGLQKRWAIFLVAVLWLLSAMSGIFSLWIGLLVELIFDTSHIRRIAGLFSTIELAIFFIVTIRKSLVVGLTASLGAGVAVVMVTGVVTLAGAATVITAGTGTAALIAIFIGVAATAAAGAATVVGAFTIAGAVAVVGAFSAALVVIFIGAGAFTGSVTLAGVITFAEPGAFAFAIAVAVTLLGAYLGYRILCGDKRNAWIGSVSIAFAAKGGTSFREADLTDADFTVAILKSTDFRGATLTRTCWHNASKLDRARPGTSYLQYVRVRQWLIGEGKDKNFEGQDLRGINLQGANLTDANFLCANLNKASLQDANLSRANLMQTQLQCADLTGATLTGAYIKDWGITTTTKLDGVRCDYVFMRLPTQDDPNPHRKPDDWNKNFAEGEFVDFITPMVLTLDLYHNRVDDPRLIAIAWQELVQENPEAQLELVSIEKRGKSKDKLLLKAETSPQVEHSVLHSDYFTNLQHLESLPPEAKQALLRERGEMIRVLAGLLTKHGSPEVSVNNHQTQEGDKNMAGDRNIYRVDGNYSEGIYNE
ncbi:MAG: pentapeptide repeat-containing protein, partial [Symploca sp. SIO2D2]|nr:pentapeptide repeat-containing protein [Symploca sp. SIO2D2]